MNRFLVEIHLKRLKNLKNGNKGELKVIFIAGMGEKGKFRTYRQILLFFILFELLGFFYNGCIQQIEYVLFKCSSSDYILVEADVLKNNNGGFKILYLELVPLSKTFVRYEIDGVLYEKWTILYPRSYEGEKIVIGVNTKDNSKLVRVVPYEITDVDWKIYFRQTTYIIILVILIRIVTMIEKHREKEGKYDLF